MFLLKNALIFASLITGSVCGFCLMEVSKKYKFKKDIYELSTVVSGFFTGMFCAIYFFFRLFAFLNSITGPIR